MRVLVVGSGAREHALVWKLAQSPRAPELFAAPGNAGIAQLATCLDVAAEDVEGVITAARSNSIDLVVVGPEAPLAAGMVDACREAGIRVFGPTKAAARIEWSKSFSKRIMDSAGAPTAHFEVFSDHEEATEYVREHGAPIVIKAEGLAAGKGVVVAQTVAIALSALDNIMLNRAYGDAGVEVVIEELMEGQEVSVFTFTDGKSLTPLVAACDYKRIYDGDKGPNTGGMGGYSPPPWWDDAMEQEVRELLIEPVIRQLAAEGTPFEGVLYGGLMLTDEGPSLVEFNSRFGDPECQLIMPRMENDLLDVIDAVIDGHVAELDLRWSAEATVAVVLASAGYPSVYATGKPITGLADGPESTIVFHAATAELDGQTVTSGGRVLAAVGHAATIAEARTLAYQAADAIAFEGAQHRTDIANFDV
ncbi:MAG: phosphoribosylamine--glycine ligase [Chloroflexi bacterium]|nr:phosphoribosylamine--glycine ligase [Chloroflexota bacterium]MDA1174666.1 phosphoribosylamine--glycine ligase [Chloroflexota bacterium]